jgi:hypothetical protein
VRSWPNLLVKTGSAERGTRWEQFRLVLESRFRLYIQDPITAGRPARCYVYYCASIVGPCHRLPLLTARWTEGCQPDISGILLLG